MNSSRKWKPNAVLIPILPSPSPSLKESKAAAYRSFSFLLTDCPPAPTSRIPSSEAVGEAGSETTSDESPLSIFIDTLNAHDCSHVIRLCEPGQYDTKPLESVHISVHDLYFEDGTAPPQDILQKFRSLILSEISSATSSTPITFAIHCISGIGRAPALIACALIDFARMDPLDAITYIRSRRRGAINKPQLQWLTDPKKGFSPLPLVSRASSRASISTTTTSTRTGRLSLLGVKKNSISTPVSPVDTSRGNGKKRASLLGWFSSKKS